MINALHYEPYGQRQRFEPREQHDRHIHLHIHLNLTLRAREPRVTHPNALRIASICAALVAATMMHLGVFIFVLLIHDGPPDPQLTWGHLAWAIVFAGLALAWGFGGLPLLVSAWRVSSYRVRLFLLGLHLSIPVCLQLGSWFPYALLMLFIVHSFVAALLLVWVSHEVGALRQSASTRTMSSFIVVSGMALTLLGGFLLDLSFGIGGVPFVLAILPLSIGTAVIAVIDAIRTLFGSALNRQAHPKDASPSEMDSEDLPRGYWG